MKHLKSTTVLEDLIYGYDPNGNRTKYKRNAVQPLREGVTGATYDSANEMLTFTPANASTKNMIYDNNGNLTSVTNSCGTTTFTRDVRNRLIVISGFDPNCQQLTANFKYDAFGRRIEKTINGVTTQYVYDGLDIVQETQGGNISANYIRTLNIDEPLGRIKADGTVRYYQADALGSVVALTDDTGAVKTTYTYDPFGNVTVSGESSDNPFQYTGRENDNTGLYYYRARYYSPELQRFISEDPIGLLGGDVNFYAYVRNNPVNFVDPKGLFYYKPGVPPAGPAVEAGLRCMDACLGTNLGISGGGEKSGHNHGSKHYTGEAADISFRMNPDLDSKKVMCCAKKCGFGFGLIEKDHYHVQIPRGIGGSRGDLPECGCDK